MNWKKVLAVFWLLAVFAALFVGSLVSGILAGIFNLIVSLLPMLGVLVGMTLVGVLSIWALETLKFEGRGMKLLVDVDDTLILYNHTDPGQIKHPYGLWYGWAWEPNAPLIRGILDWLETGEPLVVWSGGGEEYARACVEALLPAFTARIWTATKDKLGFDIWLRPGDIVVDDDVALFGDIKGIRVYRPDEWPEGKEDV